MDLCRERLVAYSLLVAALIFNGIGLLPELTSTRVDLNDNVLHFPLIQGMAQAIEQRSVGDLLDHVLPHGEGAVTWRLLRSAQESDWPAWAHWNAWFRASRETAELSAETEQTGSSLLRLLDSLDLIDAEVRGALPPTPITLPAAFSLAARGLGLGADAALTAYLWAWLENQVLCAMKSVPLGQVAGQKLLLRLGERIPHIVLEAKCTPDDDMTSFAPGLAIASSRHETQYTRLFRS